ncbi:MAG: CRTAC1 family protein [Planctomycetota bacterium]|nr:CRTAC1 family protein [Planctomycetota bacterium]
MNKPLKLVIAAVVLASAGLAAYFFFRTPDSPAIAPPVVEGVKPPPMRTFEIPDVRFTDITKAAGIQFVHENGASGDKLLPETMGSGCAFMDYDNDGDPDLLFVNGRPWSADRDEGTSLSTPALYENDGHGRFSDVTARSGLSFSFVGMGVTCADYDNDGFTDVYLTGVGRNILLHNEAGESFADVTEASGAGGDGGWSTGATFLDYDNDGNLDLWVCNYIRWSPEIDMAQGFQIVGVGRAYGPPRDFAGANSILYKGDGRGGFVDVSVEAGVRVANPATGEPMGKSLAVLTCDFDEDGRTDVMVANDTVQNFLFHNQGDGRFSEIGVECGLAFDDAGFARGAMGIDAADYRNDGLVGIAIANFANEMSALYVPMDKAHRMVFTDAALAEGIGTPSRRLLKFGMFFFDLDLDGRLDVLTVNGHLDEDITKVQASQQFAQPAQLFWNCGSDQDVSFIELGPEEVGPDLFKPIVGRGSAFADIDGDGDLDLVFTNNGGRPLLLRNDCPPRKWIRLALVGDRCNRSAIGARVEVHAADVIQRREVRAARSYLSFSESVLTFGLGDGAVVDRVVVHWPGGDTETLADLAINETHVLEQGGTQAQ